MAITTTLSIAENSVPSGQPLSFRLLVANDGADLSVTGVVVVPQAGASCNFSAPSFMPGSAVLVTSSSSLNLSFPAVFFAQLKPEGASSEQTAYSIYTLTTTSDGAISASNTINMQVTPSQSDDPVLQIGYGALRFDSQNNLAFLPALL